MTVEVEVEVRYENAHYEGMHASFVSHSSACYFVSSTVFT